LVYTSCQPSKKDEAEALPVDRGEVTYAQTETGPERTFVASAAETEIVDFMLRMHTSWEKLVEVKDADEVLQHFAPSFITNQAAVFDDNSGAIRSYSQDGFADYLKSIIKRKGFSYVFSDINFLDIGIKDNIFFYTVYKCTITRNEKNQEQNTSTLIITATGQRIAGEWKVGNYSWVSFADN
jgi:hypothetical protein